MADLDSILSGDGEAMPDSDETTTTEATTEQQVTPELDAAESTDATEPPDGEPQDQETEGEDGKDQKMVPQQALHAEKQKVKRYTEQVADFQKQVADQDEAWNRRFTDFQNALLVPKQDAVPEEKPDFWDNPTGYLDAALSPITQGVEAQLIKQREDFSLMMATEKFGADKVQDALKALNLEAQTNPEAPARAAAMMQSEHPYGALVDWHGKQKAMLEFGGDPDSYREKMKAEILAEIQQDATDEAGATPAPTNPQVMPSNLAGTRNVGSRSGPAWAGPQNLNDIFNRG